MNSWKLASLTLPLVFSIAPVTAAGVPSMSGQDSVVPKRQLIAQQENNSSDSMPHGPGSAWANSFSPENGNQQQEQMQSNYAENPAQFQSGPPQAYNAPEGGYSSPYQPSSGYSNPAYLNTHLFNQTQANPWRDAAPQGILSSRVQPAVLPEGLVLPIQLDSSIDIDKAQPGDYVQAHITQNISAGGAAYLPGGSVVSGSVSKASDDGQKGHSGKLSIDFVQVKLPNGRLIRMNAHLLGRIANYVPRDPTSAGSRFAGAAWRGGLGSGLSSGVGTVFSAVADGGSGPGGGAYAGAFMGGASGLLETLFYRHGHRQDTFLHPGTRMQMQLDSNLDLPSIANANRYLPGSGQNTGIFLLMLSPVFDLRKPLLKQLRFPN